MYVRGQGVPQNGREGERWLRLAGGSAAAFNLAYLQFYDLSAGDPALLLREPATEGRGTAEYYLGLCHLREGQRYLQWLLDHGLVLGSGEYKQDLEDQYANEPQQVGQNAYVLGPEYQRRRQYVKALQDEYGKAYEWLVRASSRAYDANYASDVKKIRDWLRDKALHAERVPRGQDQATLTHRRDLPPPPVGVVGPSPAPAPSPAATPAPAGAER